MQASGGFRLIVRRGPQPNQVYELTKDVITVGRDITNDVVINDPEVSRHHSRFTRTSGGYTLEDLGSTNGTFVNGQRLTSARPLTNGDMIGMGETVTMAYEATMPMQGPGPTAQNEPSPFAPPGGGPPPQQQQPYQQQPQQPQQPFYQQPPQQPYQQQPPQQPYQQPYGGIPQQQQPYGGAPQQPGYMDAAGYPQQAQAGYYEEVEQGNDALRYILLGCGFLVVLCVVIAVVAVVIIDTNKLWCDIPLGPTIVQLVGGDCSVLVP